MALLTAILALLITLLVVAAILLPRKEVVEQEKSSAPSVLQQSRVYLNETFIACHAPRPFHGKIDQAFKHPETGRVIPVDSKPYHPARPYASDLVQLSTYGYILRHGYGEKVAEHGYIRMHGHPSGRAVYVPTKLLNDNELHRHWERCSQLRSTRQSRYKTASKLCPKCEFRRGCQGAQQHHG